MPLHNLPVRIVRHAVHLQGVDCLCHTAHSIIHLIVDIFSQIDQILYSGVIAATQLQHHVHELWKR